MRPHQFTILSLLSATLAIAILCGMVRLVPLDTRISLCLGGGLAGFYIGVALRFYTNLTVIRRADWFVVVFWSVYAGIVLATAAFFIFHTT